MNFVRKTITNASVATLDFSLGGAICTFLLHHYGEPVSPWTCILGGFLGLAPDMDIWSQLVGQRKDHHRSFMHYPLLIVPAGAIIGALVDHLLVLPRFTWGTVIPAIWLVHFLHDMSGTLGGLALGWPFSTDFISTEGRSPIGKSVREAWIESAGPEYHNIWLDTYWGKPSSLSLTELSLAIVVAGLSVIHNSVSWPLLVMALGSMLCMIVVWVTRKPS